MNFAFISCGEIMSFTFGALLTHSIRKFHPNANIIQISDPRGPNIKGVNDRINFNFDIKELMKHKFEAQIIAIEKYSPILFLDSDMILINNIKEIDKLLLCSDLILTNRYENIKLQTEKKGIHFPEFKNQMINDVMPFIASFVGCNSVNSLISLKKICDSLDDRFKFWYGDQIAIKNLYDKKLFNFKIVDPIKYNYSPNSEKDFSSQNSILHFKGNRKEYVNEIYPKIFGSNIFNEI